MSASGTSTDIFATDLADGMNWNNTTILDPASANLINNLPADLLQTNPSGFGGNNPTQQQPGVFGSLFGAPSTAPSSGSGLGNFAPIAIMALIAVGGLLLLSAPPKTRRA